MARRRHLLPEDADDLVANVKLALIENDYAVLRAFGGRCALGTYVASVAQRLAADEQFHVHGRWRPSAESKRAGDGAVLLETLVVRDQKSVDEALPLAQKLDPAMTRASAAALLEQLPKRAPRARLVPLDDRLHEQEVGAESVEERAFARDRAAAAATANAIVTDALTNLPADDRVLLRLRFDNGMRVSAIARAWQCDQQILYRRIDTIVRRLQRQLIEGGIDTTTAAQLIGDDDSRLAFGWSDAEKSAALQTNAERSTGSEEVP